MPRISRIVAISAALLCAVTAPAVSRARQAPVAVTDLLMRYEQGESITALGRLSRDAVSPLVRDLRREGESWSRAAGEANAPRRRVAVAAFALELIELQQQVIGGATLELLDWSCGLMRDGPATPAEHTYYRASLVILQAMAARWGIVRVGDAVDAANLFNTHLLRARRRFSKDPEFALMEAIAVEVQASWPGSRDDASLDPVNPQRFGFVLKKVEELFYKVRDEPITRAELEIRWGVLELRGARTSNALEHFDRAGVPAEPALRYWLHLFRGQAYERAGRPAEAIASYRLALEDVPHAQSAAMALVALLVEDHHPDEGAALVAETLSVVPAPLDPWVYYQYPHFRLWPGVMSDLRRAVRR